MQIREVLQLLYIFFIALSSAVLYLEQMNIKASESCISWKYHQYLEIDQWITLFFVQNVLSMMCCISGMGTFQGFWYSQHGECNTSSTDINSCEQCECGRTHTCLNSR